MKELDSLESENNHKHQSRSEGFHESLWKPKSKAKAQSDSQSENFLADVFEACCKGQSRWGRNPRTINRNGRSTEEFHKQKTMGPCFNCNRKGYYLRTYREPKIYVSIKEKLLEWKQRRNIRSSSELVNVSECVENVEGDEELIETLFAMSNIYEEPRSEEDEKEKFNQDFLHNRF